jgi:hypothetical protein
VQEQRDVTGSDITVHGNVYGNISSRGGKVVLDKNLVRRQRHRCEAISRSLAWLPTR